jgi:N6-L-threonylcarbamoyladenine synthase
MILALETSCDETAVAVFDPARGLVGEWVHSQVALHEGYGGVVPDLASREHLAHLGPLLTRALPFLPGGRADLVAVTQGPGLAACLAMGVASARALGLAWGVPVVGVNHLRAHALSPFLPLQAEDPAAFEGRMEALLPHLGLLVSGGNTVLFALESGRRIRLLATTLDDAAGEALDKGAKLLGLGYPGGPQVERLARGGAADAFRFPKAVPSRASLDFSFSGLKTSLRYTLEKMTPGEIDRRKADLAASYQAAVMEALGRKLRQVLDRGGWRSVGLSGGVANNRLLQEQVGALAAARGVPFLRARPEHTGDNAGMIAFAAWAEREPGALSVGGPGPVIAPSLPLAS